MKALILLVCLAHPLSAQQDTVSVEAYEDTVVTIEAPDAIPEELLEQVETEPDASELLDRLLWLQEHPFDLNRVTPQELETIPGILPEEAKALVDYRRLVRRFSAVSQVGVMEAGEVILEKIRPYVYVATPVKPAPPTFLNVRSRAVRDLQQRKGFNDGSYLGSPVKTYTRLWVEGSREFEAGAVVEKDAGERFKEVFASGYVAVKDLSIVSRLIAGDYVVEAGQGLVFWRASAFGKGSETVSTAKKSGLGPTPYRSTDEFNFFRGGAVTTRFGSGQGSFAISLLYSQRTLSGSSDTGSISSFYTEGLYRTETELQKRNVGKEKLIGGRLVYSGSESFTIGVSASKSTFDKTVRGNETFEFTGRSTHVVGADAEVRLGWIGATSVTFFGEAARSAGGGVAAVVGSILRFSRKADVALLYRDYSVQFHSFHANGFGERGDTRNERGMYVGVRIAVSRLLTFSGYLDHFKFPWRTFSNPFPTTGRDMLLQADASLSRRFDLSARYTNKSTETTEAGIDILARETRMIVNRTQQKLRLTGIYRVNPKLRVKGRIEATHVELPTRGERGYLFYQDLKYEFSRSLSTEMRLVFFHTDSYDSRLYVYENDLRGVFSNPAMYGRGRRWYLLVRYRLAELLSLSAKYVETQKEGVTTIGSGSSEIAGDLDNRISVQIELRL